MWLKKENDENFEWIKDDDEKNEDDTKNEEDEKVIFNEVRVLSRAELSRLKSSSAF